MKKFFIALMGGTVLLIGLALLVFPGPGLPIVAAGLAILATEFLWARHAWRRAKGTLTKMRHKFGFGAGHPRASKDGPEWSEPEK